ncbi:MAG: CHAT domain-containing protein, partial [Candidatus Eremiobacterota bacterium]
MTKRALLLLLLIPALAWAQDFEAHLRQWAQQKDLARLGQEIQFHPDETRALFQRCLDRGDGAYFLNALARGLLLAGHPEATEALKARNLLFLPTEWDGTAFETDPEMLTRRTVPTTVAAEASNPAADREAAVHLAVRVGDFAAARGMLQTLQPLSVSLEVLEVVSLEGSGFAVEALAAGERLQPADGVWLDTALLMAGRRAFRPAVVDRQLAKLSGPLPEATRFVAASLRMERDAQRTGLPSFPRFLERHQEAWSQLRTLDSRSLRTGEGRWLCTAAGVWVEMALELAAREAEEYPVRAQLDYLVRSDLRTLEALNQRAFEQSFGLQPSQPRQFLQLWNPELALGRFALELDTVAHLMAMGREEEARDRLAALAQPRVDLEKRFDEASLAFQLAWYSQLKAPPPPGASDPFLFLWNQGEAARLLGRYHALRARQSRGQDYDVRAELAQARKFLEGRPGFAGLDDWRWAQLDYLLGGKPEGWQLEAAGLAEALLGECRQVDFRPGVVEALTARGMLRVAEGHREPAIADLQEATRMIEQIVLELGGGPEAARTVRQRYRRAYDLLTELLLQAGRADEAMSLQARFAQVESLAAMDLGELSRGQPALRDASQRLAALKTMVERGDSGAINKTRSEFYLALDQLRRSNPDYERLLAVRPVNFARLQPLVPEDVAVVQFFPGASETFMFVLTSSRLQVRKTPVGRKVLEALVTDCRRHCARPFAFDPKADSPLRQSLVRLHELLVGPVEEDLAGKSVVAFVPTGQLHYLPFSALARPRPDGGLEFLVQRKQVVVVARSSDLEQLSRPRASSDRGLLAVGNPDGSLPAAASEAQSLAGLFPGSRLMLREQA